MDKAPPYFELNHPRTYKATHCYLCSRSISESDNPKPDHIIPRSLFSKGQPSRPTIQVHHACNNAKSKDDRFFIKQIELMCSLNPKAGDKFMSFLNKAMEEKPYAYIVGKSKKIPNYKLAKDLLANDIWGWKVQHKGETLHAIRIKKSLQIRRNDYVAQMARGLYMRNVTGSLPPPAQLSWIEYRNPLAKQNVQAYVTALKKLVDAAGTNKFIQDWEGEVMYVGSQVIEDINKGFVYIEFYNTIGVLAYFGPEDFKKN